MIKIAICDDDNSICSQIEKVILDYERSSTIEIDIEVFYTGEALIELALKSDSTWVIFNEQNKHQK